MTERKLASIRRIAEIKPINGADAIECAVVDGWEVVIKKNEFLVGDHVVYFEIDSVLPVKPEFEFLRKSCYVQRDWLPGGEGFRLRTIRLRGQVSQGLIVPMSSVDIDWDLLPEKWWEVQKYTNFDLTKTLNITKWDPPVPTQLVGQAHGNFPSFVPKTDEERCQNLTSEIEQAFDSGEEFEISLKLDGSSCTTFLNEKDFGICSRNFWLKDNEENKNNSFIRAVHDSNLPEAMYKLSRNVAIQAELMGPGVQGNRENLSSLTLFVFNIFDIDRQEYMSAVDRVEFFQSLKEFGFSGEHVPVLYERTKLPFRSVSELLKFAEGPSLRNSIREGIVFKSLSRDFSFKAINNQFLLQETYK